MGAPSLLFMDSTYPNVKGLMCAGLSSDLHVMYAFSACNYILAAIKDARVFCLGGILPGGSSQDSVDLITGLTD